MCAVEDCEPMLVARASWQTARKPYRCVECGRCVRPGESYHKLIGLPRDDDWITYRTCRHCHALAEAMNVLCGGWPIGWLADELVEHWHEGYASLRVGRWVACLRLRWHDGTDPAPDGVHAEAQRLLRAQVDAENAAWAAGT